MKEETLYYFSFLCNAIVTLVDASPVLRQLVIRNLGMSLKMISWQASRLLRKTRADQNPEVYGKGAHH